LAVFEKNHSERSNGGKEQKVKTEVLLAVVALSYVPLGLARNKAEYPNQKVVKVCG